MGTSGMSSVEQDDLEKKYKTSQIRAARAQVGATLVAVVTVVVAVFVAWQGQVTVSRNSQTTLRQSEDTQLSTAITALGSEDTAERVAGLLLLARNTSARFLLAPQSGEAPGDVFDDYTTALQIFSGYLSNHGESFLTAIHETQPTVKFGRGYGLPPPPGLPLDLTYAANQVQYMVGDKMESDVGALKAGPPAIDLSDDELIGQRWPDINFGWVNAYLAGIDLRGADLEESHWSRHSYLAYSYLQCANLRGADFRGANLTYADLRGANVQGADFRGAKIAGIKIKTAKDLQIYGIAKWPRWLHIKAHPINEWDQAACLRNTKIWDNQPTSVSTPPHPHSQPSSSPTPAPSGGKGK